MWRAASVLCLLAVGSAWALPVTPVTAVSTQENFDLSRFMGRWYSIAEVSTCPHRMQRFSANPIIATTELEKEASATKVTKTTSFIWDGVCKRMTTSFGLTEKPGMFIYFSTRMNADVEVYVVETDYNDYAIMLLQSTCRITGNKTKIMKLYSRSLDITDDAMNDYKAQVTHHGLDPDSIIMGRDQGQCVQDGQTFLPEAETQAK